MSGFFFDAVVFRFITKTVSRNRIFFGFILIGLSSSHFLKTTHT